MLRLQHITLLQFKNYSNHSFDFSERIIGICGRNGAGKTNLLDAIHYLCFTKSYFTRQDAVNVQQGKPGFRIEGLLELHDKKEKAVCVLRETPSDRVLRIGGRKEFSVNDEPYEKFSHHIGRYPCVVIAPDDAQLITGRSDERRKFLDELISQLDPEYLQQLIVYTKVLQQRNSLLRTFAETQRADFALLDVLDEQLIRPGEFIFSKRKEFLVAFLPLVKHIYAEIAHHEFNAAQQPENINLFYESELLQAGLGELLTVNRNRDCAVQRTQSGIHRDELEMEMNDKDFKAIASQGQRKSLLFALKLAELEILQKNKGFAPLLLLDDVFEKLDEGRINNLLQKVCIENEGQVFITDTNQERLKDHLEKIGVRFQLLLL